MVASWGGIDISDMSLHRERSTRTPPHSGLNDPLNFAARMADGLNESLSSPGLHQSLLKKSDRFTRDSFR